jgi:glycine/D-amino acid oxidase-like deaminating enzyme
VVACDGHTSVLAPELADIVYPVRNQMLATEPLADVPIDVPTHSAHGHLYYRPTADGRLAVGGLRALDPAAERTGREGLNPTIQAALERFVRDDLGLAGARVTHRWSGVMGFSPDLLPVVGGVPGRPGVYVAAGFSGDGNVQGFLCGEILAASLAGRPAPFAHPYGIERFSRGGELLVPDRDAAPAP